LHQAGTKEAKGTLYVVATPIGNMRDITLRALDVLGRVDVIAAEDTRNTTHLLSHHGIRTKLLAVHEHNEREAAARLISLLESGKSVALVSDAGTPAVSDPGALVVGMVREAGLKVEPIPGPNAAICAISAAGLAAPHFLFYGFLPHKSTARRKELVSLKGLPYTLVFYEAPHRILDCIQDIQQALGSERSITFARELTKLFETIYTCPLGEALDWLNADPNRLRGEFVLLVEGAHVAPVADQSEEGRRLLTTLLAELPLKQAVKLATEISGGKKNELYALALEMKQSGEDAA
jgi:16S rRNA (cytidine1402-2'-O)-methyltransferase